MRNLFTPILAFALASPFIGDVRAETWTNKEGREIVADLLSATEDEVTLKMANGKDYTIALDTLSKESQAVVAKWLEDNAPESEDKADADDESVESEKSETDGGKRRRRREPSDDDFINFDEEWPASAKGEDNEVTVFQEDEEKGEYIYHSPHYEFVCDARLGTIVVRRFARLFESTLEYCKALPLSLQKPRNVGEDKGRFRILLFANKSDYTKEGGPPQSAGVYKSGEDIILVPLESLGVKKSGKGYSLDFGEGNKTLPHEITHQLTDSWYFSPGARGWFTEGLAEYVGTTPYNPGGGTFSIRSMRSALVEYVTAYGEDNTGGRALGTEIHMMPLREWMTLDYGDFLNVEESYGMAALVTYYFLHLDGEGEREAINAFLMALREGKVGEDALEALRNGRSWSELADAISKGWRGKGIKIIWEEDPDEEDEDPGADDEEE